MKNVILSTLLFIGFFLISPYRIAAQDGSSVTAGIGLPEMLNLGFRLQFKQSEIGLAAGIAPGTDDKNFALSGDYYYHFGGHSELTELRPWFVKTGLTYLQSEDEWTRNTSLTFVPRVGREFNITSKFGIALEGGILFLLIDREKVKKERENSWFDLDLNFAGLVLPAAGINLYYRL